MSCHLRPLNSPILNPVFNAVWNTRNKCSSMLSSSWCSNISRQSKCKSYPRIFWPRRRWLLGELKLLYKKPNDNINGLFAYVPQRFELRLVFLVPSRAGRSPARFLSFLRNPSYSSLSYVIVGDWSYSAYLFNNIVSYQHHDNNDEQTYYEYNSFNTHMVI